MQLATRLILKKLKLYLCENPHEFDIILEYPFQRTNFDQNFHPNERNFSTE